LRISGTWGISTPPIPVIYSGFMVNILGAFHPAVSGYGFLKRKPYDPVSSIEYYINIVTLKETPMPMSIIF